MIVQIPMPHLVGFRLRLVHLLMVDLVRVHPKLETAVLVEVVVLTHQGRQELVELMVAMELEVKITAPGKEPPHVSLENPLVLCMQVEEMVLKAQ